MYNYNNFMFDLFNKSKLTTKNSYNSFTVNTFLK